MDRELDADIAEHIYGWKEVNVPPDYDGINAGTTLAPPEGVHPDYRWPNIGKVHRGFLTPEYSSNIVTALRLAQYVKLPLYIKDIPLDAHKLACLCWHFFNHGELPQPKGILLPEPKKCLP